MVNYNSMLKCDYEKQLENEVRILKSKLKAIRDENKFIKKTFEILESENVRYRALLKLNNLL